MLPVNAVGIPRLQAWEDVNTSSPRAWLSGPDGGHNGLSGSIMEPGASLFDWRARSTRTSGVQLRSQLAHQLGRW